MIHAFDVVIVGGGASGFFTAVELAGRRPELRIGILERGAEVLGKVKISGGGRCNVTHACFIPNELAKFYPRGGNELKSPFHIFCSGDTMQWFADRGVKLKIEDDNRMFPITDSSQTIIDCFVNEARKYGVKIITQTSVQSIEKQEAQWLISTNKDAFRADYLVMATGSNPKIWDICQKMGHQIVSPVPSLFTFNVKDAEYNQLMGISVENVSLKIKEANLKSLGALLITHWGFSGPAILKLSAWGARELHQLNYHFTLQINWTADYSFNEILDELMEYKQQNAKKQIAKYTQYQLTNRLWQQLVQSSGISSSTIWADATKKQLVKLAELLTNSTFEVKGKSTFKEEFVTAGGIELKEINFKTMESKLFPNLFFAGEILNIDAITGGFNFQNAWTTGFITAQTISERVLE